MGYSSLAMAAFAREVQFFIFCIDAGEGHAQFPQPAYLFGSALGHKLRGFRGAQADASAEGVLHMVFHAVIRIENGRDAALGVTATTFGQRAFGNNRNFQGRVQAQRRAQPGGAAADNQYVVAVVLAMVLAHGPELT